MTDRCGTCGRQKETYDVFDPSSQTVVDTEVVCPYEWRHN